MAEEIRTETVTEAETVAEPEPLPTPVTEPEPVTEFVGEPVSEPTPPDTPPKKKRTIRTRKLFTGALVLGVVGGIAAGYTIQALRKPTPLPALSVAQPVYPAGPIYVGVQPPALPAGSDDASIVNGDLTKLLLPTPAGATVAAYDHGWMELSNLASLCDDPGSCFTTDVTGGVARIADTSWKRSDGTFVEIRIFQYQPGSSNSVDQIYTNFPASGNPPLKLPAGIAATGYEYKDSDGANDDHAVAVHGSLAVYFWVTSTTRVPDPSIINDLITRQMARL
jgi:hypothetical protein